MFQPLGSVILLVPIFSPISDKQVLQLAGSKFIPFNLDLSASREACQASYMVFPEGVRGKSGALNTTLKHLAL